MHGNLPALVAVLDRLDAEAVDSVLCAGDVVGYGPQPDACVQLVAGRSDVCVAGNHDLLAIGWLTTQRFGGLARAAHEWTLSALGPDSIRFLEELPRVAGTGDVLVTHGALDDVERYVRSAKLATAELAQLRAQHPAKRILVNGHTHQPWLFGPSGTVGRWNVGRGRHRLGDGPYLLNPGSVGQSRQRERRPRARCAILDLANGVVEFLAVEYDVEAALAALRERSLPQRTIHLRPSRRAAVRRWARRWRQAR